MSGAKVDDRIVGGARGEVIDAIVGGEVPMDGEGAATPGARNEDSVEARRVAIVSEGDQRRLGWQRG